MKANPVCSCGMVMNMTGAIGWCSHCDERPKPTHRVCYQCQKLKAAIDQRVRAEHAAEKTL